MNPGTLALSQSEQGEPSVAPEMEGLAAARYAGKAYVGGTLKLHLARYLHVDADFVYYRPVSADLAAALRTETVVGAGQGAATGGAEAEPVRIPSVFRLTQSRRMRSRELHYLDHPMFGVIVQVTPYEGPGASASTFGLDSGAAETAAPAQTSQ